MKRISILICTLCFARIALAAPNWDQQVSGFSFHNADIQKVIDKIGEMTGYNYVVDPSVRGKITITENSKTTLKEAYKAFLTALAINGFSIVKNGDFFSIRSARNVQRDEMPVFDNTMPPDENRMVTAVITPKYLSAEEINRSMRIIPSKDGEMAPYPPSNSVILSDYAPNVRRVMKLIKILDVPSAKHIKRKKKARF